jgi:16S rRNA (uracil1498-N3)-methyltransferase
LVAALQPGSQPLKSILAGTRPRSALILIGPEGDLTPAEYAAAEAAGCRPLSLGRLVLRADTAALYALSILHHELQAPSKG